MVSEQTRLRVKAAVVAGRRARRAWSRWLWKAWPKALRGPFEVVDSFDVWAYRAELAHSVSNLLDRHGVEHLLLDRPPMAIPELIVDKAEAKRVLRILRTDEQARRWWLAPSHLGPIGVPTPARMIGRPLWGVTGVMVSRNLVTADGLSLTNSEDGALIQFWTRLASDVASKGGGTQPSGSLVAPYSNGVLDVVDPPLWQQIQQDGHVLSGLLDHLMTVTEPVDVVYTWVDGQDPAWQARKAEAFKQVTGHLPHDAATQARFESRDELRYSLRSLEMYANWINHIWIVTDQQRPDWLHEDERLTVVDHREIFADTATLPVFNSHAIESQLHHIPGLAERYLYFNDDMLLASPVRPEAFFHGNRIHRFFVSPALIDVGGHDRADHAVTSAAKNNRSFVEREFGAAITNKLRHTPQASSRSLMEEFEARHPEMFADLTRSRFRRPTDHALTSSLAQYYGYVNQRAVPGVIANGYVDLVSPHAEFQLEQWLRNRDRACICINDSGADAAHVDGFLHRFFENYYPLPSRWEKR